MNEYTHTHTQSHMPKEATTIVVGVKENRRLFIYILDW